MNNKQYTINLKLLWKNIYPDGKEKDYDYYIFDYVELRHYKETDTYELYEGEKGLVYKTNDTVEIINELPGVFLLINTRTHKIFHMSRKDFNIAIK